jgi:hypothetical protein
MHDDKNTAWVFAGKHGWVDIDETEFENIEETPYGDRMYFSYKGTIYSSQIVLGGKPG